jgi:hypothetical protein
LLSAFNKLFVLPTGSGTRIVVCVAAAAAAETVPHVYFICPTRTVAVNKVLQCSRLGNRSAVHRSTLDQIVEQQECGQRTRTVAWTRLGIRPLLQGEPDKSLSMTPRPEVARLVSLNNNFTPSLYDFDYLCWDVKSTESSRDRITVVEPV